MNNGLSDAQVLSGSEVCFICGDGVPVVVHEGLPLCEPCHEATDHVEALRVPADRESGVDALTRSLVGAGFELFEVR